MTTVSRIGYRPGFERGIVVTVDDGEREIVAAVSVRKARSMILDLQACVDAAEVAEREPYEVEYHRDFL